MSKIKLFPHQTEALKNTEGLVRCAYFMDMGLGKTYVGSEKAVSIGNKIILIICQKSKVGDWVDHFRTNYPDISVMDMTTPRAVENWFDRNGVMLGDEIQVMVINYELAWRRPDLLHLANFTLMLDESSLIQNRTAKQSKFVLKLKPSAVVLLSGTPVGGKYENLWTQVHLMGWKISEDLYNRQYVNWETIEAGGFTHKIVSKIQPYKNVERLKSKMREHGAVFMKTEEVVDLPEQTFIKVKVDPIEEYWKFRKKGITLIDEEELVGDTTLTKLLYSRQICGHYNDNKLEAFRDLIQSTNERLIVFYNFNKELVTLLEIARKVGKEVGFVNGSGRSMYAYEECENSVTFIQYRAGSKGLNLQKANKIIYFTLPLSSEDFEQSKKRIHRIGQKKTCFYYLMITKGSVEEQILHTLEERKDFTDELFKD